jgi:hypothetical protein
MDEGIRSEKSLSLGMLQHPQDISKEKQATKLGDAPSGIPSFCWKYALEAIIKWLLLYFLVHDNRLLSML